MQRTSGPKCPGQSEDRVRRHLHGAQMQTSATRIGVRETGNGQPG
eukprot:SAG31_NODE_42558_length_271_cov_0.598837_1_plen_44_part_10